MGLLRKEERSRVPSTDPYFSHAFDVLFQVVGKVPSSDSINNDAEMNQIVALVVNDPLQDLTDSLEFKANKKEQVRSLLQLWFPRRSLFFCP